MACGKARGRVILVRAKEDGAVAGSCQENAVFKYGCAETDSGCANMRADKEQVDALGDGERPCGDGDGK